MRQCRGWGLNRDRTDKALARLAPTPRPGQCRGWLRDHESWPGRRHNHGCGQVNTQVGWTRFHPDGPSRRGGGWRPLICATRIQSHIGICGIDRTCTSMRFRPTVATVITEIFSLKIEAALAARFLPPGNILVMNNAANHSGKCNTVLKEWPWERHRVFALFLPARAPEWNPIELAWNCLESRLT